MELCLSSNFYFLDTHDLPLSPLCMLLSIVMKLHSTNTGVKLISIRACSKVARRAALRDSHQKFVMRPVLLDGGVARYRGVVGRGTLTVHGNPSVRLLGFT